MNHQTTNSSIINNPSNPGSLSSLAGPDHLAAAPAETPLPKRPRPKTQSPAKAVAPNAAATTLAAKNHDRCRHYTATGRRCRLAILDPASGLCFRHVGRQFQPSDEDLSPAFTGLLSGFESPSRIHAFLTQLTVLLVQNRISTRRAAILAYLGQTLLRTLPAINNELGDEQQIIFDLPRPKSDWPEGTDPAIAAHENWASYVAANPSAASQDPTKLPLTTPVAPDGYDGYTSIPDPSK